MNRIEEGVSNFLSNLNSLNVKSILGVSGGVDSMVLLAVLHKIGVPVIAVHFNFMLREKDADLDQMLVQDFCKKNNIPFFVKKENANKFAKESKIGVQLAAREMRYAFFREVMQEESADKIITAHHADDQIETVLLNLLRASGINGLCGMPVADNDILRPMISISKEDIYKYAKENEIPFREDISNESDKYQRNFLRNKIIPQLVERFPKTKENILQSSHLLEEATVLYEQRIEQIKKKLIERTDSAGWRLPIRKLKHYKPRSTVLFELFKDVGLSQTQLPELLKLLGADNGARLVLPDYSIYKDRHFLLIQSNEQSIFSDVFIEKKQGNVMLAGGKLIWELFDSPVQSAKYDKNVATLDAKNIKFPLRIRLSKEGDYFYPLGMKKKKKLSRFFIDNKYSPIEKERALIVEMDKKILWLVGQRIDDRFRVSENTTSHYRFIFRPDNN